MGKNRKGLYIPLAYQAEEAFKKAVTEALAEHRLHGIPIAIWRDGKVVRIPPSKIVIPDSHVEYASTHKMRKR